MSNQYLCLIDGLKHISQVHRSQFDERRKTEWKIVFTVLAFYFGIITAKITNSIDTSQNKLGVTIVIFFIAFITIFYLRRIHIANHTNKIIAQKAEDAIVKCLKNNPPNLNIFPKKNEKSFITKIINAIFNIFKEKKEWEKWKKWSWYWQCGLLISIAICSAFITNVG